MTQSMTQSEPRNEQGALNAAIPATIPVLAYHAIGPQPSPITITSDLFNQQMVWLSQNGYKTVSLSKLLAWLTQRQPLPERTIALTFDDGFASTYTHAFPLLAEYGFTATIFLISDYSGKLNDWPGQPSFIPRYPLLNWEQVREMAGYGFEFGAHTRSHPRLDQLGLDQAEQEILLSKARIEDELGTCVTSFAYPYGFYNEVVKKSVEQHFAAACSTDLALVTRNSDPFALERIEGFYLANGFILQSLLTPLFPKYIGARRFLRTLRFKMTTRAWR
jgi:peptidoglycan/xylan/chitin deacetylase (PgdA/CDA1 family)